MNGLHIHKTKINFTISFNLVIFKHRLGLSNLLTDLSMDNGNNGSYWSESQLLGVDQNVYSIIIFIAQRIIKHSS